MMFSNREQAARLLAGRLHHLRGSNPLILAIPRGAVPMGAILADSLHGDLDVVLVRKLGFPNNPEVALGAVDESGEVYLNEHLADYGITDEYIERERRRELTTIRSRRQLYTPVRPDINPAGRTVVVVDDGTATGFTLSTALRAVARKHPRRLIAAVAVASSDALKRINNIADEVVCLHSSDDFVAVGQYFAHFDQVSDDDAMKILTSKYKASNK